MHRGIKGYTVWSEPTEELTMGNNFKDAYVRNVSQHTLHRSLLHMDLRSHRLVRVPMMTPVH